MYSYIFTFFVIVITLTSCVQNNAPISEKEQLGIVAMRFQADNPQVERFEIDSLFASLNDYQFVLDSNFNLFGIHKGQIAFQTEVSVEEGFFIETAFITKDSSKVILFYTETDNDVAGSQAECYHLANSKRLWKNKIPGFNLSPSLIYNNSAYVATIGFVGKINLNNGKYEWRFDDLYNRTNSAFNNFEVPIIKDSLVIFESKRFYPYTGTTDFIIINDKTGKMIPTPPNVGFRQILNDINLN